MKSLVLLAFLAIGSGTSASPALAQDTVAAKLLGSWKGSYTCLQGETGLTLSFERQGDGLAGTFDFYQLPSNPDARSGYYVFRVEIAPDGVTVRGIQDYWVRQPTDYIMVDFEGRITAPGLLAGQIMHPSCQGFAVRRLVERGEGPQSGALPSNIARFRPTAR